MARPGQLDVPEMEVETSRLMPKARSLESMPDIRAATRKLRHFLKTALRHHPEAFQGIHKYEVCLAGREEVTFGAINLLAELPRAKELVGETAKYTSVPKPMPVSSSRTHRVLWNGSPWR